MAISDTIERVVKIAGIIGGLAAAGAVYVQLSDLNRKDQEKRIEDWQSSAVFKIIENKSVTNFNEISLNYTSEAAKLPSIVPRDKLDDAHLQLVLLRLIQGNAIIQTASGGYAVRRTVSDRENFASTFRIMNESNRQMATAVQVAFDLLLQSTIPLTRDQLQQRMQANGVDALFLRQNFPMVLQQMNLQGQLAFTGDGRVTKGTRDTTVTNIDASPEVKKILPDIDPDTLRFLINTQASNYTMCFRSANPAELQEGGQISRLMKLNLVAVNQLPPSKDPNGKPCTMAVEIVYTNLFGSLQMYYMTYLKVLFSKSTL